MPAKRPRSNELPGALQRRQEEVDLQRLLEGIRGIGLVCHCIVREGSVWSLEMAPQASDQDCLDIGQKLIDALGHGCEMDPPEVIDRVIRVICPVEGIGQDQLYLNHTPVPGTMRLVFR